MVIFTRGAHLVVNADGTGRSPYWRVSPTRRVDRVIIYRRQSDEHPDHNDVLLADYDGLDGPVSTGRYIVLFRACRTAGYCASHWHEFAESGTYPIRYLTGT